MTNIAMENCHWNSGFSHDFHGDFPVRHVKLPVIRQFLSSKDPITETEESHNPMMGVFSWTPQSSCHNGIGSLGVIMVNMVISMGWDTVYKWGDCLVLVTGVEKAITVPFVSSVNVDPPCVMSKSLQVLDSNHWRDMLNHGKNHGNMLTYLFVLNGPIDRNCKYRGDMFSPINYS